MAGVPDLSTYKYDPGPDPASWARTISFGTATDTTYILGFEGCVATVSGGTQDVGIQFLGDPEKNLDNGGLWLMGRANDSPRNGKDRTSWALMTLLAGKPFYFGYGGLQAIRVKGAGLAGTVNIFVSKKGPGC